MPLQVLRTIAWGKKQSHGLVGHVRQQEEAQKPCGQSAGVSSDRQEGCQTSCLTELDIGLSGMVTRHSTRSQSHAGPRRRLPCMTALHCENTLLLEWHSPCSREQDHHHSCSFTRECAGRPRQSMVELCSRPLPIQGHSPTTHCEGCQPDSGLI